MKPACLMVQEKGKGAPILFLAGALLCETCPPQCFAENAVSALLAVTRVVEESLEQGVEAFLCVYKHYKKKKVAKQKASV